MKHIRWIPVFLVLILLVSASAYAASGRRFYYDGAYHDYEGNIFRLKVDGVFLSPEVPPLVFSDYSVVPARSVFQDGLGAKVGWNAPKRQVSVALGETRLVLTIDKTTALVNGKAVEMPIPAKIINDYTVIPARFVAEALNMEVDFDTKTDTVIINSPKVEVVPEVVKTTSVTGAIYSSGNELGVITLKTDADKPEYDAFILENPLRLVVDVKGGVFKDKPETISVKTGNITQIRFGQQEGAARMVVDLAENLGYAIKTRGSQILVSVILDPDAEPLPDDETDEKPDGEKDQEDEKENEPEPVEIFKAVTYGYEGGRDYVRIKGLAMSNVKKTGSVVTVSVSGDIVEEESEKKVTGFFGKQMFYTPKDEKGGILTISLKSKDVNMYTQGDEIRFTSVHKALPRSVTLDAGHGGQDGGAVAYNEDGTIKAKEKDFNLDIVLRAQKLLEAEGVEVHMIRTEDVYVDFLRVGSIANDAGTSLFVSVHTNSALTAHPNGIETYGYLEAGTVSNGMTSARLSEILLEEMLDETGAYDRGVKDGKSLAVVNSTKMPATLVEIGFISNEEECAKMMTEAYRQKLAQAICEGVLRAFEEMDI